MPEGEVRNKLTSVHARVAGSIVQYLFSGCPILILALICFIVQMMLKGALKKASEIFLDFAQCAPGIEQLESLAIESEKAA